jgi:hypothetical protein
MRISRGQTIFTFNEPSPTAGPLHLCYAMEAANPTKVVGGKVYILETINLFL